jgi:dihydrofolate reductase
MLVSIIVAMDRRGLIGDATGLPWHLPGDLRRFRSITWGKPIIMGRKTFESIGKRPLPGRFNIVLSQNPGYSAGSTGSTCRVARTLQEALALAADHGESTGGNEVMIIGGGKVYADAIHRCNRLYLTVVEGEFRGNTYFPVQELLSQTWRLACAPQTHPADERNHHSHSFQVLERDVDAAPCPPRPGPEPAETPAGLDLADILRRCIKGAAAGDG